MVTQHPLHLLTAIKLFCRNNSCFVDVKRVSTIYTTSLLQSLDQSSNTHALAQCLTVAHRNRIEAIQKRVFRIIFDASDYLGFCTSNGYHPP